MTSTQLQRRLENVIFLGVLEEETVGHCHNHRQRELGNQKKLTKRVSVLESYHVCGLDIFDPLIH